MTLHSLLEHYALRHDAVGAMAAFVKQATAKTLFVDGLRASATPLLFAALTQKKGLARPFLFILNDEEEAGYFYHDLAQCLGDDDVLFFPSTFRRAVKYAHRDAANEILRTEALNRLSAWEDGKAKDGTPLYVVTYPAAIAERVPTRKTLKGRTIVVRKGELHDLTELSARLQEIGFQRRDYVYEPGEFAVRGSILDVYSYAAEYPFRIDFFGDEIDSIRSFEVQTQLSKGQCSEVSITADIIDTKGDMAAFPCYLPTDTCLVVKDLAWIREAANKIYEEGFSRQALAEQEAPSEQEAAEQTKRLVRESALVSGDSLMRDLLDYRRIEIGAHPSGGTADTSISLHLRLQPSFHKNFDLVQSSLSQLKTEGYTIYIAADSTKQIDRLRHILEERNGTTDFDSIDRTLHEGFVDDDLRIAFFTDHQIFDRFHKYNLRSEHARDAKMALTLKEIMQFEPGDYVVHIDHGVGRFAGLVRMAGNDGSMQEMIKLTYQNEDSVFVSIHALHKVSKYKGREGEAPRLSRLGTGAWEKLKERTKQKIKDIARDLIKLYSRRREEQGFAFSADTFMQHELEAGFAYEDTPDQLKVTQEVKTDMESSRPMDRLVCGDVGFGKTEIAVRAALKAACDNKQVVVLVPTTVLALQHYKTFASRLKDFPVRVDYLSRARTPQQTRTILKDLADGNINIIIGTHKLIGKNIKFKDLGLLIIDEEQKFGVAGKEK